MKTRTDIRRRLGRPEPKDNNGCDGECEGFGMAWKAVEGRCRGEGKNAIFNKVVKAAQDDAERKAKEDCDDDPDCVCSGKFTEIASGRVTVDGVDGKSCVFYAIYYYKGECALSI